MMVTFENIMDLKTTFRGNNPVYLPSLETIYDYNGYRVSLSLVFFMYHVTQSN